MRYTTKTEYGLVCLVYMAKCQPGALVSIDDIVEAENMPSTYIRKIFQTLRAADIVCSHAGKDGGFSLARPAHQITLKEIIDALEGATFDVFCGEETREHIVCTHFSLCALKPVWMNTKQILDQFYDRMTLADMLNPFETKNEKGTFVPS